ncbi:hypothetical protein BGX30_014204 [Mortierella sp. GBA39]|nr:hypothetical protein BGX30_014204 [Mortierella sp. GBA39]
MLLTATGVEQMNVKLMTIFGAVLGSVLVWAGSAAAEERFTDLQHSKWAEDGITYMAERGTVAGYGNGKFMPEKQVTRAQAVTFMVRELYPQELQQAADGGMTYTDVRQHPVSLTDTAKHWAAAPILMMSSNGLIGGYSDGTFRPDRSVTRAEFAVFMSRVIRFERQGAIQAQDWDKLMSYMTVSEQVGQMLMPDIRQWNGQVNFAPVLDINSNPDNPIIGMRSFGSNPDLVTRMGLAEIQGLRQSGVIAAVKHFPGHGDTVVDSHLGMPVLSHDRERLDAVELKPFRSAIDNGVEMIMTAHIAFPAVDNDHVTSLKDGSSVPIPATLSKKVLTGLLRGELGYKGVIISDAFTMNAIAEHFGENQAVLRAVSSGVDIILMPQDPAAAHQTLVNAVKSGEIPIETIHSSVKRILELKAKYGLFDRSESLPQQLAALNSVIGSEKHRTVEREIAERAVTLLAGRDGAQPDQIRQGDRVAIVAADEEQAKQLERQLKQASNNLSLKTVTALVGQGKTNEALQAVDQADYVILASYQFRNVASQFGWADDQTLIDEMNKRNKRYTLLSLGNPYETIYIQNVRSGVAVYGSDVQPTKKPTASKCFQ